METEREEISESVLKRVYYAARDGMAIALYDLLSDRPAEQIDRLVNQKILEDDDQRYTPLIVAAQYGRDRVVKMLLDKFKPDLEQEATVQIDGYVIERASALWCAAGAGHLTVVKILVKAGANVNHPTEFNSTPFRVACYNGRLDIVTYLTEHRADINIANKFNDTCLIIAAGKGHLDVVEFLLDNGAKINERGKYGDTALHFAADSGHANVVSKLLEYGTEITKNDIGMTPLALAAARCRENVVEIMTNLAEITKPEIITAYELLGASYAIDKENYCLTKAYKYLCMAMELRYSDPENVVEKRLGETINAYENWKECETLDELENIRFNSDSIHNEALAIRERILGSDHPHLPDSIIRFSQLVALNGRLDRCVELWLHALTLLQLGSGVSVDDLSQFAQILWLIIIKGVDLNIFQVFTLLDACVMELSRTRSKINSLDHKCNIEEYDEKMDLIIKATLYTLTILAKLLTRDRSRYDDGDINKAYSLVHQLCSMHLRLRDGQTLLHLAVNSNLVVNSDVCKYPCAATVKLLIRCGADVNAMDNKRNTPLHIVLGSVSYDCDIPTLQSVIVQLVEAGAHTDIVNYYGQTPCEAAGNEDVEMFLRTKMQLSLKCIAAKVVKAYNLSYSGKVPRALESFIELHGTGR